MSMVKSDHGRTHPRTRAFEPQSKAFTKGTFAWGFYHLLSRKKMFSSNGQLWKSSLSVALV